MINSEKTKKVAELENELRLVLQGLATHAFSRENQGDLVNTLLTAIQSELTEAKRTSKK